MPTILTKKSDTPGAVPATANLTNAAGGAELAVNTADKRLFSINGSSVIIEVGTNPSSLTCADASFTVARVGSLTITSLTLTNATVTSATVTTLTGTSANITTLSGTNLSYGSATITTGNLTFSSTAQRITGDMSNATVANRLAFQNSVTNQQTLITVLPNGSATTSGVSFEGDSATTNGTTFQMINSPGGAGDARFIAGIRGTGSYLPMTFYTGGSERVRIDTSGNVGIGTSTLVGGIRLTVLGGGTQLSPGTAAQEGLRIQRATGYATLTGINNDNNAYNGLQLFTGASAAVTVDTSGNVGIGRAPNYQLDVYRSGTTNTTIAAANDNIVNILQVSGNTAGVVGTITSHPLIFTAGNTERMRIDSSGNVGIGGTAPAYVKFYLSGTYPTSINVTQVVRADGTIPSGSTSSASIFQSVPTTQAASFTLPSLSHFNATQTSFGAGSTVTSQYGFVAESTLTGATNNYGFYSAIASGSNRWNFYAAGTAQNYFAGNTGVGTTTIAGKFNVGGGRSFFGANSETYSIAVGYTQARCNSGQTYYIGATDSATPDLVFSNAAGTERMRIADNGEVIVGITDQGAYNLQCNGTGVWGAGAYVNGSDARLKDDITTLNDGLNVVSQLRPVTFKYKPDYSKDQNVQTGFIAQELQAVLAGKDYVDGIVQAGPNHLNVAYQSLIPILVKAIQELTARVAELEAK
jgi:hypothetical protein